MTLALQQAGEDLGFIVPLVLHAAELEARRMPKDEQIDNPVWWAFDDICVRHRGGEAIICDLLREFYPSPPAGFEKVGKSNKDNSVGVAGPTIIRVRFWPPNKKGL